MHDAPPRGLDLSMAALYDKALKRKDFWALSIRRRRRAERRRTTGNENVCIHLFWMCGEVLMVNLGHAKAGKRREKEKAAKVDDSKADVGKIANLMAEDANRVSRSLSLSRHRLTELNHQISQTVSGFYLIYGGTLLPPLPNACLLTYNQCSTIRDSDCLYQ